MNEVIFRFVLANSSLGSQQIAEPIGWDEATLKLERDKEFVGIVEFYDQPMTFYRESFNGSDGGYDYIYDALSILGPDGDVTINIQISEDEGDTYEDLFSGLVDLSTYTEIDGYKIQCGIIRNDLWSKFINRRSISVDFNSTTDLDGGTRPVLTPENMLLSSQKLRQTYLGRQDEDTSIQYASVPNNEYGIIDFEQLQLDEIKQKFNYPRVKSSTLPNELFAVEYGGNYHISSDIYGSTAELLGNKIGASVNVYLQINNDSPIGFTETAQGTDGIDGRTRYRYSADHTLEKGDFIRIYFQNVHGSAFTWVWFANLFYDSFLRIDADTTYDDTYAKVYPLHEAFQSVCDRILGFNDSFSSTYLGHAGTQRQSYAGDGCGSPFVISKGLHIRGYDTTEKPFTASFDDLWNGANPILALGLQYKIVDGVEKIRISSREDLFDENLTAIYLNNVNNIEKNIDTSNTYKNIKIGYNRWESEDYNGLDDPQTKHEYAAPLKKIGEEITLYSDFIAASLAIENTRRKTIIQGNDYKLDNEIFIIAADKSALYATPPVYSPDLDDDFSSITDLLNSDTRYNLTLTPGRNFLRWYRHFNGPFYDLYSAEEYKFVAGEGNLLMSATKSNSCPADGALTENSNISMGITDGIYGNEVLSFDHPLSWSEYKTIRDNKNSRIMVSTTSSNHIGCFIDSIDYSITKGLATFKLWKI